MVVAVRLLPAAGHPQVVVVSRLAPAWGAVLLDESPVNAGPNELVGVDRHSVKLTEARNQSWKPQDPVGLLWVHRVSCGRNPCKQ